LDFLPPDLDFLPSGLDFLPPDLDFLPAGLDFLPSVCRLDGASVARKGGRLGGVAKSHNFCNCSPWRGEIDVGERVEGGLDGFEGAD
jgi:hypothetical protein